MRPRWPRPSGPARRSATACDRSIPAAASRGRQAPSGSPLSATAGSAWRSLWPTPPRPRSPRRPPRPTPSREEPCMLERLRELLPPPAEPVEAGRSDGWAEIEAALGTALPGDFKAFTERYGSGTVDDFLYLFNPFAAGEDGNLLAEKDRVLAAYARTRARFPERLRLPPFPEPGGVLPLGRTDNGDELYWVTRGDPGDWPVALMESRAARQEVHRMPVTGFLAALAAGELPSRILPKAVLSRPSHQFIPLG